MRALIVLLVAALPSRAVERGAKGVPPRPGVQVALPTLPAPAIPSPGAAAIPSAAPAEAPSRLRAALARLLPRFAERPAPIQRAEQLIARGELLAASELLNEIGRDDDAVIENHERLQHLFDRIGAARAESYDRGEQEQQDGFAKEAARAGIAAVETAKQEGGSCLFCSLDSALISVGDTKAAAALRSLRAQPAAALGAILPEPGVGDANVKALASALGIGVRQFKRAELPKTPEALKAHLDSRRPALGSIQLGDWRHIVHLRSAFYSKTARELVVGVQDSAKGRIVYRRWSELRNLLDSMHLLETAKPSNEPIEAIVARHYSRRLDGVFIQQEQEVNLLAQDPRDSSGDVFRYYCPVELRPELLDAVVRELGWLAKTIYGIARGARFWKRGPTPAWEALPREARLLYLVKLEAAIGASAWDDRTFLLLERRDDAPDFIAKHPGMEFPAYGRTLAAPYRRFLWPEIITAKERPAASVGEAIARTKLVIAQTGNAGTQYHAFAKIAPERLAAQLEGLKSTLQLVNDALFLQAARESFDNVVHPTLKPWHAGRSRRVAELVAAAAPGPVVSEDADPDNEKLAFVGFRYWGVEDGKLVVSLEFRGTSISWTRGPQSTRGIEGVAPKLERDYAQVERVLTFLALYMEALVRGEAPSPGTAPLALDPAEAESLLAGRARERGMAKGQYLTVAETSMLLAKDPAHPGLLQPFALPASAATVDAFLTLSARLKVDPESRNARYMFWQDYAAWAQPRAVQAKAALDALTRSVASASLGR